MNDEPNETEYLPTDRGSRKESSTGSATARKRESLELQNQQLGDFRVLRRLGKGGMAEVYLADQISLKRQVAIKVLRADLLDEKDTVLIKRFEQEASAAGGLNHPNIVQVYMVGEHDGIHYIAQEYVQGANLKDFIRKKGPLDLSVGLHVMRQTAAALQAAADAGIVHRDIKPENLMLTRKGEVKVADFGLAQLSTNKEGMNLTQVGMTMGTPLYMSPEQIQGKKVDHRSDIYSFGVTCYYLLTGRAPFEGETPLTIAVKHINENAVRISEIRNDLPQSIVDLVHKMMAKKPEDRVQSAAEIVQLLKKITKLMREDPDDPALKPDRFSLSSSKMPRLNTAKLGKQLLTFLACAIPVFGLSAAIGWTMRTADPLKTTPRPDPVKIEPEASAQAQYLRASRVGTSAEWRAVIDFVPRDEQVTYRAKVQLALALLREGLRPEAEEIFTEFENRGFGNKTDEAIGKAGRAILAYMDGQYETSLNLIKEVDRTRIEEDLTEYLQMLEEKTTTRLQEQQKKETNAMLDGNRET